MCVRTKVEEGHCWVPTTLWFRVSEFHWTGPSVTVHVLMSGRGLLVLRSDIYRSTVGWLYRVSRLCILPIPNERISTATVTREDLYSAYRWLTCRKYDDLKISVPGHCLLGFSDPCWCSISTEVFTTTLKGWNLGVRNRFLQELKNWRTCHPKFL